MAAFEPTDTPMDDIAFLARSDHRVEVLDAICAEPRTREEIRTLTDASRVTTGRIIADLEERGWIQRTGTRYETTPSGRFVITEFTRLLRNLETFEILPPVTEWFPDQDEPAFDLCLLDEATVVTADESDLIAPIHRTLDLIDSADHVRVVGNGVSDEFVVALRDAVENGQTNVLIVPPAVVETMRDDPDLRTDVRAMLESGRTTLLQHERDERLPVVNIADGTVALCSGDHRAMVEIDEVAVYDWATSYFASLRADSTLVPPEAFADDPDVLADETFVE